MREYIIEFFSILRNFLSFIAVIVLFGMIFVFIWGLYSLLVFAFALGHGFELIDLLTFLIVEGSLLVSGGIIGLIIESLETIESKLEKVEYTNEKIKNEIHDSDGNIKAVIISLVSLILILFAGSWIYHFLFSSI
ncbi:hypothetical protein [Sulfurimonas sp. C5]|uniref:hypothetical protein n=1 Tax=Sulfurimonas sp. C5 TaxID=3036947 RepID=UPI002456E233|nr:hypothetical protein [Sulfurimonas sp. C5]MDH4944936.1 hypothetical protein [Sulfurimonas sp. C5]